MEGRKLTSTEDISLLTKDPKVWKQLTEKYDSEVIRYAIRWARIMEQKMTFGAKLENIAQASSQEANVEGITQFMYEAAVSFLLRAWKHGEQLYHWRNPSTQIGDEDKRPIITVT